MHQYVNIYSSNNYRLELGSHYKSGINIYHNKASIRLNYMSLDGLPKPYNQINKWHVRAKDGTEFKILCDIMRVSANHIHSLKIKTGRDRRVNCSRLSDSKVHLPNLVALNVEGSVLTRLNCISFDHLRHLKLWSVETNHRTLNKILEQCGNSLFSLVLRWSIMEYELNEEIDDEQIQIPSTVQLLDIYAVDNVADFRYDASQCNKLIVMRLTHLSHSFDDIQISLPATIPYIHLNTIRDIDSPFVGTSVPRRLLNNCCVKIISGVESEDELTWNQIKQIWHESDDKQSNQQQQPSYKALKGRLNIDEFTELVIDNENERRQFISGLNESQFRIR